MAWDPKQPDDWAEIRAANRKDSRQAPPAEQPAEPVEREPREYEVLGSHGVFGAAPGSRVELALTEGEERALIEAGHLVLVDEEAELPVEEKATAAETATVEVHQEDDLSQ